jgi:hypothetical protein
MAQCPRDGSTLVPAPPGTSLGADALNCPRCGGGSASRLGASWFLSELGLSQSWPELVKAGEVQKKGPSTLKCARCAGPCDVLTLRGVELDVCSACGAAWFDGGEVQRLSRVDRPGNVVGVFEMFWDCAYCDTRALLGKTNRYCPNCGAPQDAKKRYFPPPGKEVAANDEYDGIDVTCPACGTPNGAKANNCKHCGSPLNEAGRVALVQRQQAQPKAPAPAPAKKSALPWLLGGGAVAVLACIITSVLWEKDVKVTVTGHSWERRIDIEEKRAQSESSWCDSLPGDAYAVSRRSEQRSTRKIADGKECHTQDHDRGNGTFERREVCNTKYREEPVYADKCYYQVDRWVTSHSVKEVGGLTDEPRWPSFSLRLSGSSLGSEREGAHHESYTVKLGSTDKKTYECDKPREAWKAFVVGKAYPMKVHVVTGGADCGSLNP